MSSFLLKDINKRTYYSVERGSKAKPTLIHCSDLEESTDQVFLLEYALTGSIPPSPLAGMQQGFDAVRHMIKIAVASRVNVNVEPADMHFVSVPNETPSLGALGIVVSAASSRFILATGERVGYGYYDSIQSPLVSPEDLGVLASLDLNRMVTLRERKMLGNGGHTSYEFLPIFQGMRKREGRFETADAKNWLRRQKVAGFE